MHVLYHFTFIIYTQTTRQRYSVTTHDTPLRYTVYPDTSHQPMTRYYWKEDHGLQADTREYRMWIKKIAVTRGCKCTAADSIVIL